MRGLARVTRWVRSLLPLGSTAPQGKGRERSPVKVVKSRPVSSAPTAGLDRLDALAVLAMVGRTGVEFVEFLEVEGQRSLGENQILPTEIDPGEKAALEAAGVQFGEVTENALFRSVVLPQGWEIAPTAESMWSELRDETGQCRAEIFYKVGYDPQQGQAFMRLSNN